MNKYSIGDKVIVSYLGKGIIKSVNEWKWYDGTGSGVFLYDVLIGDRLYYHIDESRLQSVV